MSLPNISNLTEQELLELNNRVIARVKELRRQASRRNKQRLHTGQEVSFRNSRYGILETGTIVKVKRTRAIVEVPNRFGAGSTRWDIALNMLNPVE